MNNFDYKCTVAKNGIKMYYKKVGNNYKRITNKLGKKIEIQKYSMNKGKSKEKSSNQKIQELIQELPQERMKTRIENKIKSFDIDDELPNLDIVLYLGEEFEKLNQKDRLNEKIQQLLYYQFQDWINFPSLLAAVFGDPRMIQSLTGIKSNKNNQTGIYKKIVKKDLPNKNTIIFKKGSRTEDAGHFHFICNGQQSDSFTEGWQKNASNGFCQSFALLSYLKCIQPEEYSQFVLKKGGRFLSLIHISEHTRLLSIS